MRPSSRTNRSVRKLSIVVALLGALLAGVGAAPAVSAIETHTVAPGDTLENLAEAHGVSVEDLAAANGRSPWGGVREGEELIIPRDALVDVQTGSTDDATVIDGVPAYRQARSLSCEFASVYIATSVFGAPIDEDDSISSTPLAENPHFGFRGNIDGEWGITDDYGIYAEALIPHLESHGFVGELSYGVNADSLRVQIDAGHPTIVWFATRGDTGFYETDADGNAFKLVPYEHVVVAYGYDAAGVYVADPGTGGFAHLDWDWFLAAWSILDGMSLAVYPA